MAERTNEESQDTSVAEKVTEDLNVLFPDQTIPIGGRQVTVHEYAFMQWLELKPQCAEIIQQLAEFISAENDVGVDDVLECFENNFKAMQILLCASISASPDFLKQLKDDEMQALLFTWWGVNKHFFLRSAHRMVRAQNKQQSNGQTSSSA